MGSACAPGQAQTKGELDVELRAAAKADAPVAERVRLYASSHALVIGNDSYRDPGWPRLSNGRNDARAITTALQAQGFEVTLKLDVTRSQLVEALEAFIYGPGAREGARLLIWFAGHGHTLEGEGYLVPIDAPAGDRGAEFRRASLSMRRFGEYMREVKGNHVLAIFDSCFAGTVFDTARSALPPAITRAAVLPVRQFITSGEAEQQVSDDGTFRKLFLDALSGADAQADANDDGYLTGSELGLFLEARVTNLTENRQTPRSGKLRALGLDRGDFVFRLPGRAPIAGPVATAPAASKSQPPATVLRGECAGPNPPVTCLWRK